MRGKSKIFSFGKLTDNCETVSVRVSGS